MEFKQITDLTTLPPEILFNFEELKKELSDGLQKYKGMVVTEDGIKDAKSDRAKLNALYKAIDDKRKEIKKECMKPYDAFERKAKVLLEMIGSTSGEIDKQIKGFDELKKEEKRKEIEQFYSDEVGELRDLLSFNKIYNDRWLNATYKLTDIQAEITAIVQKVNEDLAVINDLRGDFITECKSKYLQTLDLSGALSYMRQLELDKQKLDEYEAKKAEIKPVQQVIQQEINEPEEIYIPSVDIQPEETKTIKIIIYDTTEAFRHELRALTEKHGIKYGGIPDGSK
jgi:hypothetical protein